MAGRRRRYDVPTDTPGLETLLSAYVAVDSPARGICRDTVREFRMTNPVGNVKRAKQQLDALLVSPETAWEKVASDANLHLRSQAETLASCNA